MTTMIDGHSVLKSSTITEIDGIQRRYRLVIHNTSGYAVHMEYRELNGATGESFLYMGYNLDEANQCYNHYVEGN